MALETPVAESLDGRLDPRHGHRNDPENKFDSFVIHMDKVGPSAVKSLESIRPTATLLSIQDNSSQCKIVRGGYIDCKPVLSLLCMLIFYLTNSAVLDVVV
jgi:hypothetical protein